MAIALTVLVFCYRASSVFYLNKLGEKIKSMARHKHPDVNMAFGIFVCRVSFYARNEVKAA